jgi:hypothetical protein
MGSVVRKRIALTATNPASNGRWITTDRNASTGCAEFACFRQVDMIPWASNRNYYFTSAMSASIRDAKSSDLPGRIRA